MRTLTLLGLSLLACSPLHAEDTAELDPLISACAGCHGSQGEGNAELGAPALAGQLTQYLARQLSGFRDGRRGGHPADLGGGTMSGASVGMSDEQIQALSSYYAQLPALTSNGREAPPDASPNTARRKQDGEIYREVCGHCHGQDGEGFPAMGAPRLDILDAAYLRRQMDSYASGQRGSEQDDDLQSVWMHDVAAHDGDREILQRAIDHIAVDGYRDTEPAP